MEPGCLVTLLLATLTIQWDNEISCCCNSPGCGTNREEEKNTLQFIVACRITAHLITPFLMRGIIARDITREERGNRSHWHLRHYHKSWCSFRVLSFLVDQFNTLKEKMSLCVTKYMCGRSWTVPEERWRRFAANDKPLKASSSSVFSPVINEEAFSHRQVT